MIAGRWQLPVHSPVGMDMLAAGAWAAVHPRAARQASASLTGLLTRSLAARSVVLTDSGTSALVIALRALVPPGGAVALPAWGCIDLTAAAAFAGVRVRLYDLDPLTLGPDLDSLDRTLARGVAAVVVTHLYGYPADVVAVRALASRFGVPVIEDAAQRAGATLHGCELGSFGDIAVLSFGRGKGTTGGSGGALAVRTPEMERGIASFGAHLARSRGARPLAMLAAQWMLGRPALYGGPASIPGLRLGEMVYRPARRPAAIAGTAAAALMRAIRRDPAEVRDRRANAVRLTAIAATRRGMEVVRPVSGAEPGYLRFVVRNARADHAPAPRLGILRGYPATLDEHEPMRPLLMHGEVAGAGARVLRDTAFTIPTHSMVSTSDLAGITTWLGGLRYESRDEAGTTIRD